MDFEKEFEKIKVLTQASFNMEMSLTEALSSIHGLTHWIQVELNGIMLAQQAGVDEQVVRLFAYFHDCKRRDDGQDAEHGQRAAEYVKKLRHIGELDFITSEQFGTLVFACATHHLGAVSTVDRTIGACYDADRLELTRVDMICNPELMSTPMGIKIAEKMQQAGEIAVGNYELR